jgi:hypothetical protein
VPANREFVQRFRGGGPISGFQGTTSIGFSANQ